MKICKKCGVEKPREDFYKEKRVKDGLQARCIECCKADATAVFRANPEPYRRRAKEAHTTEGRRERTLRENYDMSTEDYNKLLEKQNGCCAMCKTTDSGHNMTNHLLVDHDHITGKVRGLLCCNCNWLLGKAKADEGNRLLLSALFYLKAA